LYFPYYEETLTCHRGYVADRPQETDTERERERERGKGKANEPNAKVISRAHHWFPAVIYGHVSRFSRARRARRRRGQGEGKGHKEASAYISPRKIDYAACRTAASRRVAPTVSRGCERGGAPPADSGDKGVRKVNKERRVEEGNGSEGAARRSEASVDEREGGERRRRRERGERREREATSPPPPISAPTLEVSVF